MEKTTNGKRKNKTKTIQCKTQNENHVQQTNTKQDAKSNKQHKNNIKKRRKRESKINHSFICVIEKNEAQRNKKDEKAQTTT